jgi:hypothetical protein
MALTKLKIEAFKDDQCTQPIDSKEKSIEALFNPDSYSQNFQVEYGEPSSASGRGATTLIFKQVKGGNMKLKLIADGTGVIKLPDKIRTVDEYVKKIKDIIYTLNGTEHRPNYLKVGWGNMSFICVCKTLDINYNLFDQDGKALRATIEIGFSETIGFKAEAKKAKKSSPDLTHIRTVKAGDTLPLMSYRIYGDSSYYLEVARANKLASVHDIKPGDQIYFPPLKK